MCEIIQLPIENINYKFLYYRAKDINRPIFEVWAISHKEMLNLCMYLSKIKKPSGKGHYAILAANGCISKKFYPIPNQYDLQTDNNFHVYIEL